MEKRGSISTRNIIDLLNKADEFESAIVLNCDTIKRGSVIVFSTGHNSELLKRVMSETDVFEKYSSAHPSSITELLKEAKEFDSAAIFDFGEIVPNGMAVAAIGGHAIRIKRALDKADAIARNNAEDEN